MPNYWRTKVPYRSGAEEGETRSNRGHLLDVGMHHLERLGGYLIGGPVLACDVIRAPKQPKGIESVSSTHATSAECHGV